MKKVTPPFGGRGNYFFHSLKKTVMTYIIKEGKELKIITVRVDQEAFFLADYAGKILARGNNTMEALIKFGELPQPTELSEELNKAQSPE